MFLSSLIPMDYNPNHPSFWSRFDPSLQNVLHIPMFMGFAYLFNRMLIDCVSAKGKKLGLILGISVLLSFTLEGLQFFVPGRYPGWGDIALNLLGAVAGLLIVIKTQKTN
jgi:glycopeptide antibiotics resistance protein